MTLKIYRFLLILYFLKHPACTLLDTPAQSVTGLTHECDSASWRRRVSSSPSFIFLCCATKRHCCPRVNSWVTSRWRCRVEANLQSVWGRSLVEHGLNMEPALSIVYEANSSIRHAALEYLILCFSAALREMFENEYIRWRWRIRKSFTGLK